MAIRRVARAALVSLILLAGQVLALHDARATASAPEQCFPQTNQCIGEPFLSYWQAHGGLAINGYPLTAPFTEQLGNTNYTVQYFERSRLELHPENAAPYNILLGQFGRLFYVTDPYNPRATSVAPRPGARYFDETGHNLEGRFRSYWEANGGLAQFGVPISEPLRERLEDGQEYEVQYFERARFELHPLNPTPYDVLLGQFGRRIVAASTPNAALLYLISDMRSQLYRNDLGVRVRLGLPTSAEAKVQGVVQPFERGVMIYRADTRIIYVAARDQGGVPLIGGWHGYTDTWDEEQPVGGGPAPVPNLFYPKRGFGKLWRANPDLQQLLGYATSSNEGLKDLVLQSFAGGQIVDLHTRESAPYPGVPDGIYAFYTTSRFEYRYYVSYP